MSAEIQEMIKVYNLKKEFKDNKVLQGITTEIRRGEVVVIIGPSGCGKSTFLRCLNLLEQPTEGEIFLDGTELTASGTDINKERQKMMMVFQHFNLFPHMTILDNISIGPIRLLKKSPEETKKKAEKLLQIGRASCRERV